MIAGEWINGRGNQVEGVTNVTNGSFMKIDCYLSPGCGSEETLRENITRALVIEKIEAETKFSQD
jgi:hypothetical protein